MILPFLILLLFILAHYFAGELIYNTFSLKKYLSYLIPPFITLVFFLSTVLINFTELLLFDYLYIVSAVLFGFLCQLLIFGSIFYVLKHIVKKPKLLAKILISLTVAIFLLGLYNALFINVKRIKLRNLDNYNSNIKIAHLSDLHLGLIYGPSYLENLVSKVNSLNVDVVVISGDLFDGNDKKIQKFIPALKGFSNPVIFVPGNHDHYINSNTVSSIISEAGLLELKNEALVVKEVEFIGFDYLDDKDSNIRREIDNLNINKENLRIVINHVPVDQAEADALGADLLLSGHTHRGQISPFSVVVNLIYGDFSYGLSKYKDMITYTSSGVGTWGPPQRTPFPGEIVVFDINDK